MKILAWIAPFAFFGAFLLGYGDSPRPGAALALACVLVVIASPTIVLPLQSRAIRIWGGLDVAGGLFCAMGMLDNCLNHNAYSGYGALVLVPLAGLVAVSMLGCAVAVTVRGRRR